MARKVEGGVAGVFTARAGRPSNRGSKEGRREKKKTGEDKDKGIEGKEGKRKEMKQPGVCKGEVK